MIAEVIMGIWAGYLIIAVVLASAYGLSFRAGQRASARDLGQGSLLPKIKDLRPKPEGTACQTADQCRLLMIDSDYLYVFAPQGPNDVPTIRRLDREVFHEIDTGTD